MLGPLHWMLRLFTLLYSCDCFIHVQRFSPCQNAWLSRMSGTKRDCTMANLSWPRASSSQEWQPRTWSLGSHWLWWFGANQTPAARTYFGDYRRVAPMLRPSSDDCGYQTVQATRGSASRGSALPCGCAAPEIPGQGTGGFLIVWHDEFTQRREAFVSLIPPKVYQLWEPGDRKIAPTRVTDRHSSEDVVPCGLSTTRQRSWLLFVGDRQCSSRTHISTDSSHPLCLQSLVFHGFPGNGSQARQIGPTRSAVKAL